MTSIFYLLDHPPYGSEDAYGILNAAAATVSTRMSVTLGLYADGVYLALAGQNSSALGAPNLSDMIYAYPEMRILAHEPSLAERGLLGQSLIEMIELVDESKFIEAILESDAIIAL